MSFLVFRLYGPLASWGQAAVGETRPTGLYPTRSAIIGLLAAALGIKREEELAMQQLNASLQLAIKQQVPSSLIRDFHTIQAPSTRRGVTHFTRQSELKEAKLNTLLTRRDYRCDGLWTIALRCITTADNRVSYSLEQLKSALEKPVYTLYLGRKSCPLGIPLSPILVETSCLKTALDTCFPALTRSSKEDNLWLGATGQVTYYWEGDKNQLAAEGIKTERVITTQPWDNPLNKLRWQFNQRTLHQYSLVEES